MPSTFTSRNRLEKQAAGENNNTWGARLNDNVIEMVDEATDGVTAFTLSGARTLTVNEAASDESRKRVIHVTGGTGGTITVPNVEKNYLVRNASSGNVVITTGAGTTATVPAGSMLWVISTGANACHAQVYSNFGADPISTTGAGSFGTLSVSGAAAFTTVNASGYLRSQGNTLPSSGAGVEIRYLSSSNAGFVLSFDRTANAYKTLHLIGSEVSMIVSGSEYIRVNGSGHYFGNMGTSASGTAIVMDASGFLKKSTSSEEYKTEIEEVAKEDALAALSIVPIRYRSTCEGDNPDWSWFGHSAERAAAVNPRLVNWGYHDFQFEEVDVRRPITIDTGQKDRNGRAVVTCGEEVFKERRLKEGEKLCPISAQYDRIAAIQIYGLLLEIEALKKRVGDLEAA